MTMAKPKYPYSTLIYARKSSSGNWGELHRSALCGCYQCGTVFLAKDIYSWIGLDGRNVDDATAICPFCGMNAVIPESPVYPLKKEFLDYLKKYCIREKQGL